jgi:myo-inositol-1(or 4)-monophosphatase
MTIIDGGVSGPPDTDLAGGLGGVALAAAWAGREAIAAALAGGGLRTDTKSAAHDLVTTADRAAEAAVLEVLRRLRPDDSVLGEETGVHAGSTAVRWLVDPLDGTVNFVYGRAGWAVSVGAEVDGRPVAGAVVCPADGRWAVTDGSAVRYGGYEATDGRVMTPRPPQAIGADRIALSDALVSLGYPYGLLKRERTLAAVQRLVGRIRGLRLTGGAASELLGLAGGDCDGFVSFDLEPWDTAAGAALVLACGGTVRWERAGSGMAVVIAARTEELAAELATWATAPPD